MSTFLLSFLLQSPICLSKVDFSDKVQNVNEIVSKAWNDVYQGQKCSQPYSTQNVKRYKLEGKSYEKELQKNNL